MRHDTNNGKESLGSVLEAARQAAGLSMRELASLSDMAKSSLERLLKDEVEQPSPANLMRLARVLELRPADLFLLAGLPLPEGSPSLDVMLRTEFRLPPEAIAEIERDVERIIKKYDGGPDANRDHVTYSHP